MIKKLPFSTLLILGFLSLAPLAAEAQFQKTAECPVMPGNRVKEKFYVDYLGERIHLCCKSCVKAFKKHPEKYIGKVKHE